MIEVGELNSRTKLDELATTEQNVSGTVNIDVETVGMVLILTATGNFTLNLTGEQQPGQRLYIVIINNGALPRVATFGTGFRVTGTLTGALSRRSASSFVSDGTSMIELSRLGNIV